MFKNTFIIMMKILLECLLFEILQMEWKSLFEDLYLVLYKKKKKRIPLKKCFFLIPVCGVYFLLLVVAVIFSAVVVYHQTTQAKVKTSRTISA